MMQQVILREIIDQRVRLLARLSAVEVAAVVLDAGADADFQQQLDVVLRARQQPLRFEQLAFAAELHDLRDRARRGSISTAPCEPVFRHHIVDGRVDEDLVFALEQLAGERVDRVDVGDLVAEELDAVGELLVGRMQLDDVAADAEGGALEVDVVAAVLQVDELPQHLVAIGLDALADRQDRLLVLDRRAEAEDAADGGDEQHVVAADEVAGGGKPQAVEVVVAATRPSRCRCRAAGCTLRAGSSRSS